MVRTAQKDPFGICVRRRSKSVFPSPSEHSLQCPQTKSVDPDQTMRLPDWIAQMRKLILVNALIHDMKAFFARCAREKCNQ